MQHAFLTKFCEHLSQAHLAPDRRPASLRIPTDVQRPEKGPLPGAGPELEERWAHQLCFAGVFLAAISCRLPLNGLQMVRKRLLGTGREDQSPVLCGRGFITGWQFMPTENGPGCRRPVGERGCLWAEGSSRKVLSLSAPQAFSSSEEGKSGEWYPEGRFLCRKSVVFSLFGFPTERFR